jgi:ABC-type sugar transport system permease subunit
MNRKKTDALFIYGFLAWPLLHFFIFWFCMNIGTVADSFFEIMADGKSREFVKFDNYIEVLKIICGKKDRGILNYHGVLNSLTLIPLSLIINLPLTVLFAYGIYKKLPLHNTFRIVLFLPAVISSVVLCLAFRLALDNSSGILIQLLRMIGLGGDGSQFDTGIIPVGGFLGNEDTMWGTILVFSVWTGVNGNLIYFSSSMARLPESVFESAELDGATQLRQFISICIPLIWPTITTMSITLVAGVFSWMMPSLLLTDGAPRATTIGLMVSQTVKNDKNNTVISAFGVLIAVFGGALIMSFRYLMEKVTEGVEY